MQQHFILIHDLDLKHQGYLHQIELTQRDEDIRRLTIRLLLLRDNAASLQDRISTQEQEHRQLVRQRDQIAQALNKAEATADQYNARIEKQNNDIAHLKVRSATPIFHSVANNHVQSRVQTQGETAQESTKLNQEKLSLSRESDRLRKELEHLKSQISNHQSVVAEKLDLQRQLDTLEVELANETRSKRRAQEKEDHALDELRNRADEAEKRLASEKKEREKMQRSHGLVLAEAHGERERVEERVAGLQTKLKRAHSDLDDAKSELARCRADLEKARSSAIRPKAMINSSVVNRKRPLAQQPEESVPILTPEVDRVSLQRPAKKRGIEHSMLGEKSAFSVTPFLNRSKDDSFEAQASHPSIIDDGDGTADELIEDNERSESRSSKSSDDESDPKPQSDPLGPKTSSRKPRGKPKKASPATAAPARKRGQITRPGAAGKSTSLASKERITPHDIEDDGSEVENPPEAMPGKSTASVSAAPAMDVSVMAGPGDKPAKKKVRKFVGGRNGTILDDDDGEIDHRQPPPPKPQLKGVRKRTALGGSIASSFGGGGFSPLKKQRRGVNASFLA
jgi:hypothetical protein